mgnify:CR=1 FL=1
MAELTLNLISAIAGLVGSVAGIYGAVMGHIAFSKSKKHKTLDLRLELQKSVNTFTDDRSQLRELIKESDISKQGIARAQGWSKSGRMDKWKRDVESDKNKVDTLTSESLDGSNDFQKLNERQLETRLVKVHSLQKSIDELKQKYKDSIDEDKETSKYIIASIERSGSR